MRQKVWIVIALGMPLSAVAGCIGPVIMGECKGEIVPWDTHPHGQSNNPPPAAGVYYDKRGTNAEQLNPGSVNPFTGRDAHDADMDAERRMNCYRKRDAALQRGIIIDCP
jgi:hypothetical protein